MKTYHDQHAKNREFNRGQSVLVLDHRSHSWKPATVVERNAPHSYSVVIPDGRIWNRHADHLLHDKTHRREQVEPIPNHLGSQSQQPDAPPEQPELPTSIPSTNPSPLPLPAMTKAEESSSTLEQKSPAGRHWQAHVQNRHPSSQKRFLGLEGQGEQQHGQKD